MPATATDRLQGLTTSVAVKPPCKAVTTTSITLSGEQTVGGVACVTGDRVLVAITGGSVSNGIWVVDTAAWSRAKDFDGARDVVNGTLILVISVSADNLYLWAVTTTGAILPGTTSIAIEATGATGTTLLADLQNIVDTAKGAALVGYLPPGTGSVGRTLYSILRERRLLTNQLTTAEIDDILSNTGATDISAKFQTALSNAGGKVLILPEGLMRADNMTTSDTRTTIVGGGHASRIIAPTAANNVFTVSGEFTEIRDLAISSAVTRSGGWYVDFAAGANRGALRGFHFNGAHGGVRTAAVATLTIEKGLLLNGIATTGVGIRVNAGFDVSIRDIIADQASQIFAGILIKATGDTTIEDCNLIRCGNALYLNPEAGQVVASVWANNSYFDTSIRGLYAYADGASASIVRCKFDEVWMNGHTSEGALLATNAGGAVNGIDFSMCEFNGNTGAGLQVNTGCLEIHVGSNCLAAGNGTAGFSFGASVSNFSVTGARAGASHGYGPNNIGVAVDSTCTNFSIQGNNLLSNTTLALSNPATGTGQLVADNVGTGLGSATYDPPNLADGAGVTTTVAVIGALVGDMVDVSFALDLQGVALTGWVSASGTVSARFQNETGGAIDLGSGALRARVERST